MSSPNPTPEYVAALERVANASRAYLNAICVVPSERNRVALREAVQELELMR